MIRMKQIKLGETLDRGELEELLQELCYEKKDFVGRPGEFAVRGGIFDVYPLTYEAFYNRDQTPPRE